MKTNTKTLVLAALLLASTPQVVLAGGGGIAGASEPTQLLQFGADVTDRLQAYAQQVQQYQTEYNSMLNHIQQTQMQIQNLGQLPAGTWNQFQNDVMNLKGLIQQGQAITFAASNLDTQFQSMFPGYDGHYVASGQSLASRNATFTDRYKLINQSTRDNVNGALKSLNLQMNDLNSDAATMSMLQQQSRSADGQLKVIQAANEIALHQTEENKKLRWTLMTQANTQAAYMAAQNEKETAKDALSERRQQYTTPNINRSGNTRRYENWR